MSKYRFQCVATAFALLAVVFTSYSANAETIVFVRHGEKPDGGYGQLSCQGLNRALALPEVLVSKYGKPDYIFAPDPSEQVPDAAGKFYYVRPLATIEPTAISLGMPVQTPFGVTNLSGIQTALTRDDMSGAVVYVAWEHFLLVNIVKSILTTYGADATAVPAWPDTDYDSIYVVTLTKQNGVTKASFKREQEGLDRQNKRCPE